jgi:predicted small metal-binding protein
LTAGAQRRRIAPDKEVHDMARVMADCRRWPSESDCSLTIIGEEEEVVRAAAEHAASVHGHEDSPEMREQIRDFLEPAEAYSNEPREHEAMPS